MVLLSSIQIFPQNAFSPNLNYYPYLFSTNLNPNFYNYFPANLSAFQPITANNIVYAP